MTTIVSARVNLTDPKLVAPLWHTALLVAIFAGLALSGALFQHQARVDPRMLQQHTNMVPLYLSLLAMEWALFLYVRKGVRVTGFSLRELVGGQWTSARSVAVDGAAACDPAWWRTLGEILPVASLEFSCLRFPRERFQHSI
jgi:hypothetical protein